MRRPGFGALHWAAEAALTWLHGPRKLRIRWEIRDDMPRHSYIWLTACMILTRKLPTSAL